MSTDSKPIISLTHAHALIAPIKDTSSFENALSHINYNGGQAIKKLGSVMLCSDFNGGGHALLMSAGSEYISVWESLYSDNQIAPAGSIPNQGSAFSDTKPAYPSFGGTSVAAIGSLDFPVLPMDDLLDGNNVINSPKKGGKKYGACVIVIESVAPTHYGLYISTGELETSPWVKIDEVTTITPGDADDEETTMFGDRKPLVRESSITAIPFPVVSTSRLEDITDPINAGDGSFEGKLGRSMVIEETEAGLPILRVSVGPLASAGWRKLDETIAGSPIVPA